MTPKTYQDNFFDVHLQASLNSAKEIIPVVLNYVKPGSVIDIGCGVGTWLSVWKQSGVNNIMGVDGSYVQPEKLLIASESFVAANLEQGFKTNRRFDLVTSLEVAEHIKTENAENFISSLCSLGDVILFSAAIPGQEGTLHYNEQYPDFWIDKFSKHGFSAYDCLREKVWSNPNIAWWYRQNILFFVRDSSKEKFPEITKEKRTVLPLVHPELLKYKSDKADRYEKILRSPYTALRYFLRKYVG